MFEELQRVALTEDLPNYGLKAEDIGMILHIHGAHQGYAVEFVTLNGELVALVSLYPHQIRALNHDEIASARRVESA